MPDVCYVYSINPAFFFSLTNADAALNKARRIGNAKAFRDAVLAGKTSGGCRMR